jgi:Tol biopolymer transport system component
VKGSPAPVLEGVQAVTGPFGSFAFSESGTLAYVPGGRQEALATTLVWVDRKGAEQSVPIPAQQYNMPRLSPDGGRVAVEVQDRIAGHNDVWVYDIARGAPIRITFENTNRNPVWTPDGKRLIYNSGASGGLVSAPADGTSPPAALLQEPVLPDSISPDGKLLIVRGNQDAARSRNTVGTLALGGASPASAKSQVFLDSPRSKTQAMFSPDGKWVAYDSDESGRAQVYVQSYPGPGGKFPISNDGGTMPRWARSGHELFYRHADMVMTVDVELGAAFRASKPRVLFEGRYQPGYDVAPDGERFLMVKPPAETAARPDKVHIVVNWNEELRRRVPPGK